jgi:far upstream element-binding protein
MVVLFSGHGPTIPPLSSQGSTPQYSSYGGYQSGGTSKKIDIPNGRVGVIIGKSGETIKHLQLQSGAKIQVTRDMDVQPGSQTRSVELSGTPDQISRAEQLINDVLAEADAGSSGTVSSRKYNAPQPGAEQFQMQIANNKVGLVIGKGGETIKSMQAKSGARIQVIPLHLPPGDTSTERTLYIDGTTEQIEIAKQLVSEVTSEVSFLSLVLLLPNCYSNLCLSVLLKSCCFCSHWFMLLWICLILSFSLVDLLFPWFASKIFSLMLL